MNFESLKHWHRFSKEKKLAGRYINPGQIQPLINWYKSKFEVKEIGLSVEQRSIYTMKLGTGPMRILAWSQMHGNESTTTKAIFDLIKYFSEETTHQDLLSKITFVIIPMFNPDGAQRYTRVNANGVDLNRDAQQLSQPESKIFKEIYTDFKPHYCFNLHGQRTIFGVGKPPKPATVSLLSPAQDPDRKVTLSRLKGMALINAIAKLLQDYIPKAVGRYDDGFNINCVGDTLQSLDIPTVLFEAGHYKDDYNREHTRELIFLSLMRSLVFLAYESGSEFSKADNMYFKIPENNACYFDIILRDLQLSGDTITDIAIQYEEILEENKIKFIPKVKKVGNLKKYYGHKEFNLKRQKSAQIVDTENIEGLKLDDIQLDSGQSITFSVN